MDDINCIIMDFCTTETCAVPKRLIGEFKSKFKNLPYLIDIISTGAV